MRLQASDSYGFREHDHDYILAAKKQCECKTVYNARTRTTVEKTPEQIAFDKKRYEDLLKARDAQQASVTFERRRRAKLPSRLMEKMDAILQSSDGSGWGKRVDLLLSKLGEGFLYSVIGTYGTGKSQLGAAISYRACEITTALFIRASELFDTIKDVYRSDDGDTVREQLEKFTKPKLLVIDEVNQGLTEADIRYLHRVICQRYDDMTDTLLISNETKPNFQALVGDRVISRMIECGGVIEADWPSFRRK